MIIETVPGVAWYDNFGDATLGVGVPEGWTKYGPGAAPTVTAQPAPGPTVQPDAPSLGGKFLRFLAGTNPVALGMDVAGSPTFFEILIRLRSVNDLPVQGEQAGGGIVEKLSSNRFGGPGGRIGVDAGQLIGIQLTGGNNRSRTFCNWFCQNLDITNPFYEPPASVNYYQYFFLNSKGVAGGPNWATYASSLTPMHMKSGRTQLQLGRDEEIPSWWPAGIGQVEPGSVTRWSWMRMRVDGSHIQGKWWAHGKDEPTRWELDIPDVRNMDWPQNPGPVGIVVSRSDVDTFNGDTAVDVDYVSVSLDPDVPAPEAVIPQSQNCPAPGRVGEAYSFQLIVDGVN